MRNFVCEVKRQPSEGRSRKADVLRLLARRLRQLGVQENTGAHRRCNESREWEYGLLDHLVV